jgi:Tfp pilus assembly protein PilF
LQSAAALSKDKNAKAFHALGMAYVDLKNWEPAKIAFRTAIELDKNDGESWFDLAMIYLSEKDWAKAVAAFQNALRYKSLDSAPAHNNLGVIAALNGNWTAAEKEFETALVISFGGLVEARLNLELCHTLNGDRNTLAKLEFIHQSNIKTKGAANGR